jgi:hypothetical protein
MVVTVAVVAVGVLSWPVCEPLDEETVRTMEPPIQTRRNERTLWFKSYEVRGRQWCRCTPWIASKLLF